MRQAVYGLCAGGALFGVRCVCVCGEGAICACLWVWMRASGVADTECGGRDGASGVRVRGAGMYPCGMRHRVCVT